MLKGNDVLLRDSPVETWGLSDSLTKTLVRRRDELQWKGSDGFALQERWREEAERSRAGKGDETAETGKNAEKKAVLRCSVRVQQLSRPKPAVVPPKTMAVAAGKQRRAEREQRERKRYNDAVNRKGGATRQLWDAGNLRSHEWGLI